MADYLLANTTAMRIEASTRSDNLAEQRALDKAGFTREGVLRAAQFQDGAWRDLVLFSLVRSDLQIEWPKPRVSETWPALPATSPVGGWARRSFSPLLPTTA